MFALVGLHDLLSYFSLLFQFPPSCVLSPASLLHGCQAGLALGEGGQTKDAGSVIPVFSCCEDSKKHSAPLPSLSSARLCIERFFQLPDFHDTQSISLICWVGFIFAHASPVKLVSMFLSISQSIECIAPVSPHFSSWEPREQFAVKRPTQNMVQSVASKVSENRPVPSRLILGKSPYLQALISSSK